VFAANGSVAQPAKLESCAFSDRVSREIEAPSDCGWIDKNGSAHIKPRYWRRVAFDRHRLASIRVGGNWYWFNRSGRQAQTMLVDTWAEDFVNGRARSPRSGKIGYVDRTLRLVIPARYDGALPFDNGVAEVCKECSLVQMGEHWMYEGGDWFCIDPRGRERRRNGQHC
jgi:hypothetical protein